MNITHAHVATGTDAGTGEVHKAEWNASHTSTGSPHRLDNTYSIDGTYGDDFTGSSLSGIWTRRTFTSGDETYQVGPDSTWIRLATNSRGAGAGYFQTAPAGDWTFACKFVLNVECGWGFAVVDTNGTGVQFTAVYSSHTPWAPLLLSLTTYSSYGGSYVEPGISGASPNIDLYNGYPRHQPMWMYVRKSSTSYFCAISHNGELWGKESSALTWSGTVDRVGMIFGPLGNAGGTSLYIDIDWFNKIA